MPIGISDDHVELADAFGKWASSLGGIEAARAAEDDPAAEFAEQSAAVAEMGLAGIAVPEEHGGAGGSLLDLAVALEAAAGALVPGPAARHRGRLRGARRAGRPGRGGGDAGRAGPRCRRGGPRRARARRTPWSSRDDDVLLVALDGADLTPGTSPDLTRRTSHRRPDRARRHRGPRPRAGAAACARRHAGRRRGIGRRAVVPRHGGGVRRRARAVRQEDRRLPGDQAPVRGDARDQRVGHRRGLGRRPRGHRRRADAARVRGPRRRDDLLRRRGRRSAKACIQVLGGIGFTFEHDAHLYLRRALALRSMVGPSSSYAARLADLAATRRTPARAHRPRRRRRQHPRRGARTGAADRRPARRRAARRPGGERLPDARTGPRRTGSAPTRCTSWSSTRSSTAAGVAAPRPEDRCLGRADDHRPRHRRAARALRRADAARRDRVVPAVQRARAPAPTSPRCAPRRVTATATGWRLTGQKVWTSLAHQADWGICLARTNPDAKQHAGITYFLVDMTSDGHRGPPAARAHRRGDVQRGLPRRRLRARRVRGRRGRRRLEAGPDHAGQRARGDGRFAPRRLASSGRCGCWPPARPTRRRGRDRPGRGLGDGGRAARHPRDAALAGRAGARARSRAWPSWSAYAAGRTPPSSSSTLLGDRVFTGDELVARGDARAAD